MGPSFLLIMLVWLMVGSCKTFDSTLGFPGEGPPEKDGQPQRSRRTKPVRDDCLVSINVTAWSSFTAFMESEVVADAGYLIQEHHLKSTQVVNEEVWAKRAGWTAHLPPAIPTPGGGTAGGVGFVTRAHRGLTRPHGVDWEALDAGRVALVQWSGGGVPGGLLVASLYLRCSVGLDPHNVRTLTQLAVQLRISGRPYIVAGDFNCTPQAFREHEVAKLFDADVVAPATPEDEAAGTCRASTGEWKTIDFFLVSRPLLSRIKDCTVMLDAGFRPHRPVCLRLRRGGPLDLRRVLRAPRRFPVERPIGPPVAVPKRGGEQLLQSVEEIDKSAERWFDRAEAELAAVFHVQGQEAAYSGRSRGARFVLVRPQIRRLAGRAKCSFAARRWYWLGDRLGELRQLLAATQPGALLHAHRLRALLAQVTGLSSDEAVADLWRRRLLAVWCAGADDLDWLQYEAYQAAVVEEREYLVLRRARVQDWARQACLNGAREAHAYSKITVGWQPDEVMDDGLPAGAQGRVDVVTQQWLANVWHSSDTPLTTAEWEVYRGTDGAGRDLRRLLPRPSIDQVRAASKKFPRRTGLGVDQWHPRHFELLSGDTLDAWVSLMMAAEIHGHIPTIMNLLTIVFIPKAATGVRPIGLFTASLRLWGRLRRSIADQWEQEHQREYFWGGKGKSVENCVWRQALASEYSNATGKPAASILVDLVKAYEMLKHRMCLVRFLDAEIPFYFARWCLLSYAGPRVLRLGDAYSEPLQLTTSIVAGCSGATTLLRAVLLRTCDAAAHLVRELPISLSVVVDDMTVHGQGKLAGEEELAREMAATISTLTGSLEDDVGATISEEKTVILGTSDAVVDDIIAQTGARWAAARAVRNLGMDFSYVEAAACTQLTRVQTCQHRFSRFHVLRGAGGAVAAVARAGPRAAMCFGAGVQGISDGDLQRIRSTVGSCAFGPLGGASLTLKFMLAEVKELDPAYDLNLQPLRMWATAVWDCEPGVWATMAVVFNDLVARKADGHGLEHLPPGPGRATLKALDRLGWNAISFRRWRTDRGVDLDLATHCPMTIIKLGRLAVERGQWLHLKERYEEFSCFGDGGNLQPIRQALAGRTGLGRAERNLLRAAATRTLWPDERRADEGYQENKGCSKCGGPRGTLRHAVWDCPVLASQRYQADLGNLGREGCAQDDEHAIFSRGLLARDSAGEVKALCTTTINWDPCSRVSVLAGHIYVDGSCYHGDDLLEARSGWGVVMTSLIGRIDAILYGACGGLIHCNGAAEVVAAGMAIRAAIG